MNILLPQTTYTFQYWHSSYSYPSGISLCPFFHLFLVSFRIIPQFSARLSLDIHFFCIYNVHIVSRTYVLFNSYSSKYQPDCQYLIRKSTHNILQNGGNRMKPFTEKVREHRGPVSYTHLVTGMIVVLIFYGSRDFIHSNHGFLFNA